MTSIGSRNTPLRIEQSVLTPDGQGGHTQTWALRAVEYAARETLTAQEQLRATQLTAMLMTAWTINYRSDLSVKDRILIGARVLQVVSYVDLSGEKDELRITCTETQS